MRRRFDIFFITTGKVVNKDRTCFTSNDAIGLLSNARHIGRGARASVAEVTFCEQGLSGDKASTDSAWSRIYCCNDIFLSCGHAIPIPGQGASVELCSPGTERKDQRRPNQRRWSEGRKSPVKEHVDGSVPRCRKQMQKKQGIRVRLQKTYRERTRPTCGDANHRAPYLFNTLWNLEISRTVPHTEQERTRWREKRSSKLMFSARLRGSLKSCHIPKRISPVIRPPARPNVLIGFKVSNRCLAKICGQLHGLNQEQGKRIQGKLNYQKIATTDKRVDRVLEVHNGYPESKYIRFQGKEVLLCLHSLT